MHQNSDDMTRKIVLGMLMLAGLTACDGDYELNPSMTGKIGSTDWKSQVQTAVESANTLTITGIAEDGKTISISVLGTSEGEYKTVDNTWETEFGAYYKASEFDELTDAWVAFHGIVNITEINEETRAASGDFWFKMARFGDTIKVEGGSFKDIRFTQP